MNSEHLSDKDRRVRLVLKRMTQTGAQTLDNAKSNRDIIRQVGRLPYRIYALQRTETEAKSKDLANGSDNLKLQQLLKEP